MSFSFCSHPLSWQAYLGRLGSWATNFSGAMYEGALGQTAAVQDLSDTKLQDDEE